MRINASSRAQLRRALDRRLRSSSVLTTPAPPTGWLRAVRQSLGMTARQLAQRLGVSPATVIQMEKREPTGKVTLETLNRAAGAMGCRVVYAIVPQHGEGLESIVETRARRAAGRLVGRSAHSMALEQQAVEPAESEAQVKELARTLRDTMSSALWDEP